MIVIEPASAPVSTAVNNALGRLGAEMKETGGPALLRAVQGVVPASARRWWSESPNWLSMRTRRLK